jgi:hypothetical protein
VTPQCTTNAENTSFVESNGDSWHLSTMGRIWQTPSVVDVWLPGVFFQKVDQRGADECWPWTGHVRKTDGYATYGTAKRYGTIYAHLILWRHMHGEVAEGCEIDHKCFNRSCMNPTHHRELTLAENRKHHDPRRRRTHCPKGHERSPLPSGKWVCRTCVTEATKAWRARQSQQELDEVLGPIGVAS